MRFALMCTVSLALVIGLIGCGDAIERDRVIILVVDGLRPDYVTAELMPRLNELSESGVRGTAHHAVFPTVTRVNGPSIFTGRYPAGHGMMGNSVYLPDVDASRVLDAGDADDLRMIDEVTGGELLTAPSLGELLGEQGLVFFAASSGSTGSGTLMNHRGSGAGLVHHEFTIPDSLASVVGDVLGPPPDVPPGSASVPLVARAIDAVLRIGLDRADADVLAAWLTEPDGTAHANGVGAPETIAVLAAVDAEIGRLLDGLEDRALLSRTNILVTSDHGFTTRSGTTSIGALLVQAGLKESAGSMDVVVAGGAIHVQAGGEERITDIVRLLQSTDWIGPVFTDGEGDASGLGRLAGTVAYSAIGWDHDRGADILTGADWNDAENEHGYAGEVLTPGVAGHGSSSPWDIRATFVAAGPRIKAGVESSVPTGNIDLVPTTLELVGAPIPPDLDGRVLREILLTGPDPADVGVRSDSIMASVTLDGLRYGLTVERSFVEATMYFDGTRVRRVPLGGG
jgi:arylsulfatase A-like enzyme